MSEEKGRTLTILLYIVTIVYMVMIFYGSSLHQINQPGPLGKIQSVDKLEHFSEYFGLAFLLALSFQRTPSLGPGWQSLALVLLIGIVYGMTDEFHQSFVSGRTSDLLDLLADSTGVTFGCLFGAWVMTPDPKGTASRSVPLKKGMTDSEE